MSTSFDDIVRTLDEDDLSVIKGYILSTVRESVPEQSESTADLLQVQATGTLEALRAFARVMAEDA